MAAVTRTLHPLPFENLEPKRFEDLVRQLAYDFRVWRSLEATGRSGSDDGFDARGYEIVAGTEQVEPSEEELDADFPGDRLWLIQCKRERAIGPTKLLGYLDSLPAESIEGLYGLIFAAACDFSKSSRDACRNWCRERGLQEVHVWGKAEIEDQLYQPKNDHLLFAYFGISLQIRRQSLTSQLRRTTTLKRKIKRHLDDSGWLGQVCLIRDPSDESFPHADGKSLLDGGFLWRPYYVKGVGTHGLRVVLRCHHGYLDTTTGEWDIATALDRSIPHEVNEYWPSREPRVERGAGVIERWTTLPRATNIS